MRLKVPNSVAIIMDGNGRWAQSRGLDRIEGHLRGVESVRSVIRAAVKQGVSVLTLYAFSTENWGRPSEEVAALMELLGRCIVQEMPELVEQGVRVAIIGDRSRFDEKMQQSLANAESMSEGCDRLRLQIALNYSSRDEITRAVREIASRVERGELNSGQIDSETISAHLDTMAADDPDLIIRTSGEMRLSNFMLWQAAYSELYITDVLWPNFGEQEFAKAIEEYTLRDRRFGLV
ncbi:MAG: isoprenyl transferase [Rikenellaceae bacterium]